MKPALLTSLTKAELLDELWSTDPDFLATLRIGGSLLDVRNAVFDYLNDLERQYFNLMSPRRLTARHIIERDNAKECIRVMRNYCRTENERLTGFSALGILIDLARGSAEALESVNEGFLADLVALLRGISTSAEVATQYPRTLPEGVLDSPFQRSRHLDGYSRMLDATYERFRCGLDLESRTRQRCMRRRLLRHYGATTADWNDPRWQLRHVIRDANKLGRLVRLDTEEVEGLAVAAEFGIPFQITPHYLTLFDDESRTPDDRCVRAQVLPSARYCRTVAESRAAGTDMDFMGEKATSPTPGITRRYPQIVILKPFDSCPQLCVYCQRNWEVTDLAHARISMRDLNTALTWIESNPSIHEVLVTGGDPLTLDNAKLQRILARLSKMAHVERIRIGTRVLVTLPSRIDDGFLRLLQRYHRWGRQEIAIMTHVESALEITPDTLAAVTRIKRLGVNIYNQHVFTYFTSRRYQNCHLRKVLKRCGIDPYYTFNTKGKEETLDFRVPMARIQQERHEEARLLPGLVRTDEPVYNVPLQGKSSLIAWQDHEPIMLLPDGRRIYRFYPWESRLAFADDYLYTDVSIYDYLKRLEKEGEDILPYLTIWYYF